MTGGPAGRPGVASEPRADLLSASFTVEQVAAVRHQVRRHCVDIGLTGDDLDDFVLAVHELVTNAVRHGGGNGRLQLHLLGDTLTCEVRDDGGGTGMLRPHLPAGDALGGRGLWLAQQLTAGLVVTAGPAGVSATVTVCVTPKPAARLTAAVPAYTDAVRTPAQEGTP